MKSRSKRWTYVLMSLNEQLAPNSWLDPKAKEFEDCRDALKQAMISDGIGDMFYERGE